MTIAVDHKPIKSLKGEKVLWNMLHSVYKKCISKLVCVYLLAGIVFCCSIYSRPRIISVSVTIINVSSTHWLLYYSVEEIFMRNFSNHQRILRFSRTESCYKWFHFHINPNFRISWSLLFLSAGKSINVVSFSAEGETLHHTCRSTVRVAMRSLKRHRLPPSRPVINQILKSRKITSN